MIQTIINQAVPALLTIIVGVLVKIISDVGNSIISTEQSKKKAISLKIGVDKYNADLAIAGNIYNMVNEYFRITPAIDKTIKLAQDKFSAEILKVIPGITMAEIEQLRQSVAGAVNEGKDILVAPVVADVVEPIIVKAEIPVVETAIENKIVEPTPEIASSVPEVIPEPITPIIPETPVIPIAEVAPVVAEPIIEPVAPIVEPVVTEPAVDVTVDVPVAPVVTPIDTPEKIDAIVSALTDIKSQLQSDAQGTIVAPVKTV